MTVQERISLSMPKILAMTNRQGIQIDHVEFIPGGKTNESYVVYGSNGKKYLARIAGLGTEKFIDRSKEIQNASVADEIGVAPKLLCANDNNLLLEYIDGECTTSTDILLKGNNVDKITEQLRNLHESGKKFQGKFSFINDFNVYKNDFLSTGYPIPEELIQNEKALYDLTCWVEESLYDEPCPVHSDIVLQNFIFTDERAYIVDWEYSTMAGRYLDLASFCTQNLLTKGMTDEFLSSYFNGTDAELDYGKFVLYKMAISFMWIYWHLNNVAHNKDKEYNEFRWRHHYENAMSCKAEWEALQNSNNYGG